MTCNCTSHHVSSDVISRDWGRGHKMGYVWCGESIVWDWLFPCSAWDWLILGYTPFWGGGSQICQIPGFGSKLGFWVKNGVLGQKWGFGGGAWPKGGQNRIWGGGGRPNGGCIKTFIYW